MAPSFLLSGLVQISSREFYIIFTLFLLLHTGEGVTAGEAASCLPNQSLALLEFKQSLSLYGSQTLLSTWQNGSDCCEWEGVSCDYTTGFVTGLAINQLGVQVSDPNSSLFELRRLQSLDLSSNLVSGAILSRLPELTDLTELLLSNCSLTGPIPESLEQLSNLSRLDLSQNGLSGEIPRFIIKHPNLQSLYLGHNKLNGSFPDFGNAVSALTGIDLSDNMLDGEIPASIIRKLPHLAVFGLQGNRFSGTIHLSLFQNLKNLFYLDLSENNLTVELPQVVDLNHQATIFPRLTILGLGFCNIKGEFPWFLQNMNSLKQLSISHNNISGKVPTWLWGLQKLQRLDLSHNMLHGFEEVVNVSGSDLHFSSNNNFSSKSPLKVVSLISHLNMANNNIKGAIPPAPFCNMFNMVVLDLSQNNLTGTIPDCLANLTLLTLLDLSENQIQGQIPNGLICGLNHLTMIALHDNQLAGEVARYTCNTSKEIWYLDLSSNRLTGSLPDNWLTSFDQLDMLDLSHNQLYGPIPEQLNISSTTSLRVLNLNDNKLVGKIPRSLSNYSHLEVINLGRNELSDVFPYWLGHLDRLRVLVLHSNRLFGSIWSPTSNHVLSSLQVLDLSGNQLTGHLPSEFFENFTFMIRKESEVELDDERFYRAKEELPLTIKGQNQVRRMMAIFSSIFTSIDLSNNLFTGNIPEEMGALKGIYSLNLSRNNLGGPIPKSFGQLQAMESLDLSHNQLSGSIPEELTRDTFLSVLDLSYNNLEGRIPQGNQFTTFNATSFDWNPGLCGLPLAISCPKSNNGSQNSMNGVEEKARDQHWEYLAGGVGFAMGLLTITLPILFTKKVWIWYWDRVDRALQAFIFLLFKL